MVTRNDASTRTRVVHFIWCHNTNGGRSSGWIFHKRPCFYSINLSFRPDFRIFLQIYAKGIGSFPTWNDKGKFDVSSEGPSSGRNFHQKVEFFFVVSGSTFRLLLNHYLLTLATLSLYNHLLSIGLILFCQQLVSCAHIALGWGGVRPAPCVSVKWMDIYKMFCL